MNERMRQISAKLLFQANSAMIECLQKSLKGVSYLQKNTKLPIFSVTRGWSFSIRLINVDLTVEVSAKEDWLPAAIFTSFETHLAKTPFALHAATSLHGRIVFL